MISTENTIIENDYADYHLSYNHNIQRENAMNKRICFTHSS